MITKWKVSNFKSVAEETELEFKPLTIFAGANSSGKSTLLQSILLIAQTLAHNVRSRSVVLNGALVRLGRFDDIRTTGSEDDAIVIGWTCQPIESAEHSQVSPSGFPRRPVYYPAFAEQIRKVTCEIAFDADSSGPEPETLQIQPRLLSSRFNARVRDTDGAEDERWCELVRAGSAGSRNDSKEKWLSVGEVYHPSYVESLAWNVVLDSESTQEIRSSYASGEPAGCLLRHFLPEYLSVGYDEAEQQARLVAAAITGRTSTIGVLPMTILREAVIPPSILELLAVYLGEVSEELHPSDTALAGSINASLSRGLTVDEWVKRFDQLPQAQQDAIHERIQSVSDLEPKIIEAIRADQKEQTSVAWARSPETIFNIANYIDLFFSTSVRYLGPLRDEPRSVYPLAPQIDPTDVGLRGELTALVLNLNKRVEIDYIPPAAFGDGVALLEPITKPLEEAVNDWLQYTTVAANVTSVDRGKLGHGFEVAISPNGPALDPMHVGVGVSQVLPILVMCLLADSDTSLIIEQPELHLHPMVQSRLGDFFLSLALLRKQCIIETHSEHLINRLRLRAAGENRSAEIVDCLKVYFTRYEGDQTTFSEIEINEFGAIIDWPDGFFDESQESAEDILRAAMKKSDSLQEQD